MAISTNGTVLARLAGALYNTQMSNATYSEVKTLDPATLADALYARDFSASTDAAVATTLVTNLGLTSVTGLVNWIAAQLTAAGSHKGAKIVDLLNSFAQMTADTTYGAYATAFNTKVDAALALSQTTDNAGGTFAAAGVATDKTFTLTPSVDTLVGPASGNAKFFAGETAANVSTLSPLDSIVGQGDGNVLNVVDSIGSAANGIPARVSVSGVQTMNVTSVGSVGQASTAAVEGSAQVNVYTAPTTAVAGQTGFIYLLLEGYTNMGTAGIDLDTLADLQINVGETEVDVDFTGLATTTARTDAIKAALDAALVGRDITVTTYTDSGNNYSYLSLNGAGITSDAVQIFGSSTGTPEIAGSDFEYVIREGTVASAGATAGDLVTISNGSQTRTFAIGADSTATGANLAAALNAILGAGSAVNAAGVVTVTGTTSAALPTITFSGTASNVPTGGITTAYVEAVPAFAGVSYDVSEFTGLTKMNVDSIGGANVAAPETTNVVVTNAGGGTAAVSGGLTQSIKNSGAVTSSGSAGAVTISDASQSSKLISVDGGTNVTITTKGTTGAVKVGANAAGVLGTGTSTYAVKPTGVITVDQTISGSSTANRTGGVVETTGGSSVVITEKVSQSAPTLTSATARTTTTSATTVTGGTATTDVSVTKAATVTGVDYAAAVAKSSESVTVQFKALAAGASTTVEGLTFTAGTLGATAAQVATAFANLAKGASAGVISKTVGTFSGALATTTATTDNFTSGAATVDTVTFTSATAEAASGLVVTTTGTLSPVATEVSKYAAGSAATGKGGVTSSAVTVIDANWKAAGAATKAGTIKSVTVANAPTLTIKDNALTSLTVTGGTGNITIDNASALLPEATTTTLALSIGGQKGGTLDDADVYKTLNVTTTAASYMSDITFGATTALTVAGTAGLGLTSAAGLAAVKTITVSGSAGLSSFSTADSADAGVLAYTTTALDLSGLTALTSVDASATSGAVKAKILATQTSYAGGSGADAVTTSAGTISKSITTGAGNDTVTITGSSATVSNSIDGGEGTDTLVMTPTAAAAVTAGGAVFKSYVTNFEVLKTSADAVAADTTIVVADLGLASNVNVGGVVNASTTLTLSKFANAGTLTISKTGQLGTVALTNATAWAANTLDTAASYVANTANIVLTSTSKDTYDTAGVPTSGVASITAGNVSMSNVGTVNITATDAGSSYTGLVASDTMTLTNSKVYTVNVSGNANLSLTLGTSTAPKTIDGSAMTGALTVTAAAASTTGAVTITGGAGKDVLTASTGTYADVLNGGAGNDTLTANTGANTLTGGTGSDKFVVTSASAAKTIYTTVTDFGAGDSLKLLDTAGTESFVSTAVSLVALPSSASLGDAVNAAILGATQGQIKWFQFGGDTYVAVAAADHDVATGVFVDGADQVVKLTGLIDLSGVGFNAGAQLLQA